MHLLPAQVDWLRKKVIYASSTLFTIQIVIFAVWSALHWLDENQLDVLTSRFEV